jgi:hypothetical protein
MGNGSFPGVKWPGRGADHPPPPSADLVYVLQVYSTNREVLTVVTGHSSSLSLPSVNFVKQSSCASWLRSRLYVLYRKVSCASDLRPSWEKLNVTLRRMCQSLIASQPLWEQSRSSPPPPPQILTSDNGRCHRLRTTACRRIRIAAVVRKLLI